MSIFVIKIIACVMMVVDHIKYAIPSLGELKIVIPDIGDFYYFTYLGRIAFPLFAFCLVEGYVHTSDVKNYAKRLLIFGLISQPFFMLFRSTHNGGKILDPMLNIMFTLLLGLVAITSYDKVKNKWLGFLGTVIAIAVGELINVDYGWYGVATCFVIYLFRKKNVRLVISFSALVIVYYSIRLMQSMHENNIYGFSNFIYNYYKVVLWSTVFSILPITVTFLYNGEKGKSSKFIKYFYYWFYPAQCLIVYILAQVLK